MFQKKNNKKQKYGRERYRNLFEKERNKKPQYGRE